MRLVRGLSSVVERQLPMLDVVGSTPIARSRSRPVEVKASAGRSVFWGKISRALERATHPRLRSSLQHA